LTSTADAADPLCGFDEGCEVVVTIGDTEDDTSQTTTARLSLTQQPAHFTWSAVNVPVKIVGFDGNNVRAILAAAIVGGSCAFSDAELANNTDPGVGFGLDLLASGMVCRLVLID
jgi:hypothetical protein